MHGRYGINFWWQLSSSDQKTTQIFRLIGITSIRKSRSRFASRKCQTQQKVAQKCPKYSFPKLLPSSCKTIQYIRRKDKPPPQKRNKSIDVFWDGIMWMATGSMKSLSWNLHEQQKKRHKQTCIPSVPVVGIDRRPKWMNIKAGNLNLCVVWKNWHDTSLTAKQRSQKDCKCSISFLDVSILLLFSSLLSAVFVGEIREPTLVEGDGKSLGVAITAPLP